MFGKMFSPMRRVKLEYFSMKDIHVEKCTQVRFPLHDWKIAANETSPNCSFDMEEATNHVDLNHRADPSLGMLNKSF